MVAHPKNEIDEVPGEPVVDASERKSFRDRLSQAAAASESTLVLTAQEEMTKHPEWEPVVRSVLKDLGLEYLEGQIFKGWPAYTATR